MDQVQAARYARAMSVAIVSGALMCSAAQAQWSVSYLNPESGSTAQIYSSYGGTQVGECRSASFSGACYWKGTASSCVSLHYAGHMSISQALGVSEDQQVGWARATNSVHAALWSGTPESFVDLHPPGAKSSRSFGVSGGVQVGYVVSPSGLQHASMWRGSAESWVDLTPTWGYHTTANAVRGDQIVGQVGNSDAALWSATTGEMVLLSTGGAGWSSALATDGRYQAGWAWPNNSRGSHAVFWDGTPESWVDLHPGDMYLNSELYAIDGSVQAGQVDGFAAVWFGTAASMVNLHALLPTNFDASRATGIERTEHHISVYGYARDPSTNLVAAVCWSLPIPDPGVGSCFAFGGLFAARRRR